MGLGVSLLIFQSVLSEAGWSGQTLSTFSPRGTKRIGTRGGLSASTLPLGDTQRDGVVCTCPSGPADCISLALLLWSSGIVSLARAEDWTPHGVCARVRLGEGRRGDREHMQSSVELAAPLLVRVGGDS